MSGATRRYSAHFYEYSGKKLLVTVGFNLAIRKQHATHYFRKNVLHNLNTSARYIMALICKATAATTVAIEAAHINADSFGGHPNENSEWLALRNHYKALSLIGTDEENMLGTGLGCSKRQEGSVEDCSV